MENNGDQYGVNEKRSFISNLLGKDLPDGERLERQRTVIIILAGAAALFFILALVQTLTKSVLEKQLDMANDIAMNAEDSAGGIESGMSNLRAYTDGLELSLADEKKRSDSLQKQVTELKLQVEKLREETGAEDDSDPGIPETEAEAGEDAGDTEQEDAEQTADASATAAVDKASATMALQASEEALQAQQEAEEERRKLAGLELYRTRSIPVVPDGSFSVAAVEGSDESGEGEAEAPAAKATPDGVYRFKDRNGDTATFTSDEWEYLLSIWEYTGKAEEMVMDHTVGELKSALDAR